MAFTRHAKPPQLSEAHIQATCSAFLELDGWRVLVTNPCSDKGRGKGFGELGMADVLYLRYGMRGRRPETHDQRCNSLFLSGAQVLWIEWKKLDAKGEPTKPSEHQLDWHRDERALGALTFIAGVDFPATIEGFQNFYKSSGLARSIR